MPNSRLIASGLDFPEGPVAMPDGSVILVEVRGQRLTRVLPDGRKEVIAKVPGGPNGAALGPDGKIWICNNGGFTWRPNGELAPLEAKDYIGGSIQRIDVQSGAIETMFTSCGETKLVGPNDLVFDRKGGLWFSDLGKQHRLITQHGGLYYMPPAAKELKQVLSQPAVLNGVGLSPDESRVYAAETYTARLWAVDIPAAGEVQTGNDKAVFVAGIGGYQLFDSLALEASGNVCVATIIRAAISVIAPDGKLIEQVETGDPYTTNICFGGPELKTAYITLSTRGELIAMDWPRPGLPLNFLNK